MKNKFKISSLLVVLLLGLTFVFGAACENSPIKEINRDYREAQKPESQYQAWLPTPIPDVAKLHKYRTPKGAHVLTEDPVPEASKALLFKSFDVGIDRAIASTKDKGYTSYRTHDKTEIILIRGNYDSVQIPGAKLLKLKNGVTACGTTVGLDQNPFTAPFILMAQNFEAVFQQLNRDCARHEDEHLQTYDDPPRKQAAELDDVHPIYKMDDDDSWYSSFVE